MATQTAPKLGTAVTYVSSKGYDKLAFVTATPETVQPGHDLPDLAEGFVHLVVFSPTGSHYPRFSVPSLEAAALIPDYAAEGDMAMKGVWKPVV